MRNRESPFQSNGFELFLQNFPVKKIFESKQSFERRKISYADPNFSSCKNDMTAEEIFKVVLLLTDKNKQVKIRHGQPIIIASRSAWQRIFGRSTAVVQPAQDNSQSKIEYLQRMMGDIDDNRDSIEEKRILREILEAYESADFIKTY